ncbi:MULTISPECIES: DoxX family protein [Kordiimonas]|jgi:putative oxidoreductase|uniref:DoxX family protein n=1 Tax=Kordiimonas TaxID=288021 RepID=UPI00257E87B3|nr:DoxX family protein [Kordiimonas sp. UBA4487]
MTTAINTTDNTGPFGLPTLEGLVGQFKDVGDLAVRVAAGAFLMPHGAQKLFGAFGGYGLEATGQFFQTQLGFSNGYLAALGAGSVEFFAGLALALGLFTRSAGIAITVMLLVASTFHFGAGFFWTDGGFEYPILWAILAASFVVKGGGRYSLDAKLGIKY